MGDDHEPLGPRLKKLREASGMTVEALGYLSGIGASGIYKIERGQLEGPRFQAGVRLAEALKVSPFVLAGVSHTPALEANLAGGGHVQVDIYVAGLPFKEVQVQRGALAAIIEDQLHVEQLASDVERETNSERKDADAIAPVIVERLERVEGLVRQLLERGSAKKK
jgi:transcriptional regulator with XRE-family HTH domain